MGCCSGKTAVKGPGFVRSHARVDISEDGLTATKAGGGKDRVAAMNTEMTEGKHFVEFNIEAGSNALCGVIRPGFDVEEGNDAHKAEDHCFFHCGGGYRYPGGAQWSGMQAAAAGDRVGMLLDLEAGSMVVYKNDERLAMMAAGLAGPYCWAVTLYDKGDRVTIKHLPPPKIKKAKKTAEDMSEDQAASAIQARVRVRSTKANKTDETREAS